MPLLSLENGEVIHYKQYLNFFTEDFPLHNKGDEYSNNEYSNNELNKEEENEVGRELESEINEDKIKDGVLEAVFGESDSGIAENIKAV